MAPSRPSTAAAGNANASRGGGGGDLATLFHRLVVVATRFAIVAVVDSST